MMTQVKSPGTAADVSGIGTVAWVNPNNIKVSDDAYATATFGVVTLASYSESNYNYDKEFPNGRHLEGQSFNNVNAITLDSCKFYLKKYGSPTGNAVARIYAMTGTLGVNGVPTGSPLATSDNFNIATLTTSYQLITFTFSGANKIDLSANTNYVIVMDWTNTGNPSFTGINFGEDTTSSTAPGNLCYSSDGTNWSTTGSLYDCLFYVYGVNSISHYLKASNFGFTVPDNVVINGILVEIEEKSTPTTTESVIKIVKADGTLGTINKSTGANLPSSEGYVSYGSDNNLWGENWTPADINDADFGVVLATVGTGVSSVDHIRITVYYGVIGPFPTFFR